MKKTFSLFIVLYLLWILVAGVNTSELILGAVVALIVSYILADYVNALFGLNSIVKSLLFIALYIPILIIELVKANVDVARRVLDPNLPLNPGFVKIPTDIKSDIGKLTLANSITLTPGTLSIDADDENVYIHWIDVQGHSPSEYQSKVSLKFEEILRRIFND